MRLPKWTMVMLIGAVAFCALLNLGVCQTSPPTPLGIAVLCINRSVPNPRRVDNVNPEKGHQLRYQILIYTNNGWYTQGSYNPRRIQGVYFDASGWSVVAVGGSLLASPTPPSIPQVLGADRAWRWASPRIRWTLSGRHIVDRETTFSNVRTDNIRRYYMYEISYDSSSAWYKEINWINIGMRIIAVRFELTLNNRNYSFYAGPPPGVRESRRRTSWDSLYNQYVVYMNTIGYGLLGASSTGDGVTDAAFTPIFVYPGQRFLSQLTNLTVPGRSF